MENAHQTRKVKGLVYFLQAGGSGGPIKIGFTTDLKDRFKDLQTACPFRLSIIYARKGTIKDEKLLHEKFSKYNLRNEWFHPVAPLKRLIKRLKYSGNKKTLRQEIKIVLKSSTLA